MTTTLRAYDRDGNRLGQGLPWSHLSRTIVRNAPGSITTAVPLSLLTSGLLDAEVYLRVAHDGVEEPDWYVLDDDGDDPADEGGAARDVAIGGKGVLKVFEWAEVYPWDHVPGGNLLGLKPEHPFNDSPGGIFAELIDRAQARGAIPHVSYSFTAEHDSAGTPWPSNFARTYTAGTSLLKVLEEFAADAWADLEMVGFRLDLFVPDTELALDYPESVLYLGKGVTQAPRKRTRAGVRSVILAAGNEGAIVEVSDPDAVAKYGRREGYEGRGSITDIGTLTAATQVSLDRQTSASESITLAIDPSTAPPIPRPGGYIRYDQRRMSPTSYEPMRVQSIAWEYGENPRLSVELADLWVDRDIRMERRIDAILNGSTANERAPQPPLGDEKPPSTPQGLSLVSAPYEDPTSGQQYAQVTATWMEVTTDVDGTPVGELKGYTIEWRQLDVQPGVGRVDARAGQALVTWSPVVPGSPIEARIAAYDRWDNYSDWSEWEQIMAGVDETPPPAPSTPVVDNYLGLLRTFWDGGFVGDTARPADVAAVEVHVSPVDGFDPDEAPEATRVGTMYASGSVFTDTPYDQTRFVRLVAVDTTGNRSEPSAQAWGASGAVVEADVFDGAIGTAKLANAAVKNAKIDDLAVNDAKIGSLNVGKLTAGILTANVTVGGRIATALTGARVELNSLGIYRWNGVDPDPVVAIDDNGALLTGTYRTATTGRRIEILAAGNTGTLTFYSATGTQQSLSSTTSWGGEEALRLRGGSESLILVTNNNRVSTFGYRVTTTFRDTFELWQGGDALSVGAQQRFFLNTVEAGFQFPGGNGGLYIAGGSLEISPAARFFSGNNQGLAIRSINPEAANWNATDNPARMELIRFDAASYQRWWASGYDVKSGAESKTEVVEADAGLLAAVVGVKPKKYRRKDVGGQGKDGPVEIGLLAGEAPEQIIVRDKGEVWGVDLYQMATMNWGATGELAAQVEELAAAVAALTKGNKP